ncbi:hypothetical protein ACIGO9_30000 [Nocardia asteroides]|uniref:hypothetical protein n=1 Tax=Nocardia asteroides TaxID=1824 RepID=UPI0037C7F3B3
MPRRPAGRWEHIRGVDTISGNTFNFGGGDFAGANNNFGGNNVTQSIVNHGDQDDRADLFAALRDAGLSEEHVLALEAALDADGESPLGSDAGQAVSSWWAGVRQQASATVLAGLWAIAAAQLGLPAA